MRRTLLTTCALVAITASAHAAAGQVVVTPSSPAAGATTRADSALAVYRRAQRLVNDGQGAAGRTLVDSMLNAAEPGTPDEAEALFWRATLAENWESAQRDYLRIMLEHDRSPRAGDAMLRLAQGEERRGDRDAALRYLERLVREAPDAPARAEAGLWHGRLLIERGEQLNGCRVLRDTRPMVPTGAVELENRYDYLLRGCPDPATAAPPETAAAPPPVAPSAASPAAPATAPPARPATTSATPATPAARAPTSSTRQPMWSVQVGAYSTKADADGAVTRLRTRGYDARVDGSAAPWRVRFGLFPTRAAAADALERYKTRDKGTGFLVEVPRG